MESQSLGQLAEEHLAHARTSPSGRSAVTIHGGRQHHLRQTLIALTAGHALGEHKAPPEATLQVLLGNVRIDAGPDSWEGTAGDLVAIPDHRHDLVPLTDAVVLLTTALSR